MFELNDIISYLIAASMVGGGFVNGTAESMGRDGLVWTLGPIGYNIGMALCKYRS